MQTSTARKLAQIPANTLIVGIDPHKHCHAAVVMDQKANILAKRKIANLRDDFDQLLQMTEAEAKRAGAKGVIFAIEAGSHCWRNLAYYLSERQLELHLVSPYTLKRQREGEDLDRRKNDYRDARMAAELLRTGKYTQSRLLEGDYAQLRALHQGYRRLRQRQSSTINLMRALLDGVFPEFCSVFRDPCGQTARAVLTSGVIPARIASQTREQFIAQVRGAWQGRRLAVKKLQRLHELAQQSVGVKPGAQAVGQELRMQAQQYSLVAGQVEECEGQLRQLIHKTEESRYLLSVTGLGELTVAGLIAEVGPFQHYQDGKDLVKLAGINPTQNESAGKGRQHTPMSKKGRSGLRECLWQAAISLLRYNPEFKAWAKRLQEGEAGRRAMHRRAVLGAAMNKLLRLGHALVRKAQMYQPAAMSQAIAA